MMRGSSRRNWRLCYLLGILGVVTSSLELAFVHSSSFWTVATSAANGSANERARIACSAQSDSGSEDSPCKVSGSIEEADGSWTRKAIPISTYEEEQAAMKIFNAVSIAYGRVRPRGWTRGIDKSEDWETRGIAVTSQEDEMAASEAYKKFCGEYAEAASRGLWLDTPVFEPDVKYRFHRLMQTLGISAEALLELMTHTAVPFIIDANEAQITFDTMVENSSREKALEIVRKNPGILSVGTAIEENMVQAEVAANFINLFR